MTQKSIVAIVLSALLLAVSLIFPGPFDAVEEQVLDVRYQLRGVIPADTNIVILYFDADDIASLGGWPLRRNFYALLIEMLRQSRAAVIGVDILFGEHNLQFPEHDDVLAATAATAGNIVVAGYFRRAEPMSLEGKDSVPSVLLYRGRLDEGLFGSQLRLPYEELLRATAGLGHTNLVTGPNPGIPVLIAAGDGSLPSFGLEVLRLYAGQRRKDIRLEGRSVVLPSADRDYRITVDARGTAALNVPGPLSSFQRFRCVEVLQAHQLQQLGLPTSVDLSRLRSKIVLVSAIGEGISTFVASTPFDPRFPPVGIHATFIDNALQGRFLVRTHPLASALMAVMLTGIGLMLITRLGYLNGFLFTALVIVSWVSASQLAFMLWSMILPVVQPVFLVVTAGVGLVLYDHLIVRKKVAQLQTDKEEAEEKLRASEVKLQLLEQELLDQNAYGASSRAHELVEEIDRYKQDIKALSAQVSDLVQFEPAVASQEEGRAEFEGIVYDSSGKMREVIELIQKVAGSDANVLVLGESGTGKELVAKAIHSRSGRKDKVFAAVNCGALTETLLESELFGHERGSFTGAVKEKIGRFEYADGGTIFLDEIAETSEAFQVKLLRVVQSGEFERVGSTGTKRVNTRIIAATNKNLQKLVDERRFREDLFYRLNVFSIELPPLRERKGDIPILTELFLMHENAGFSPSSTVMDAFLQYAWPGNVRELESAIKRATILARAERRELIQLKDLPEHVAAALKGQVDLEDQIIELLRVKKFSRSSISETAEELGGLNRGTVAEYLRGLCFKFFFENLWNVDATVRAISKSDDGETNERVRKKIAEYLTNVIDRVNLGSPFEQVRQGLRPKYKNLPQRYHTILDEVIRSYLLGRWK